MIEEDTPGGTVYYYRTPDGVLIARYDSTNGIRYYHYDELGSTRLLTDSSGSVTDSYSYDAYGSLIWHEKATGSIDQPYQYVGQLGYYTHYQDAYFGLLQLGVRFYDPEIGRFTQRDRFGSTLTATYVYVDTAPTVHADPTGLAPIAVCLDNYGPRIPKEARNRIIDCFKKGGRRDILKCLRKVPRDLGKDGICSILACWLSPDSGTSEGTEPKYRGYACNDPRWKKYKGYCMGCANWNRQKCDCEAGFDGPGLAYCKNQETAAHLKCEQLPCDNK